MLIKTTFRLHDYLKKSAEKKAFENNTTFQKIFNLALEAYLKKQTRPKAGRTEFYPEPK